MAASPPQSPDQSAQLPTYTDSHAPAAAPQHPSVHDSCIASALARFEYEAGHTSVATATKVLLIEWEDGSQVRGRGGEWTVEWKGRKQTVRADEGGRTAADADAHYGEVRDEPEGEVPTLRSRSHSLHASDKSTHRLYFILPAGTPVPASVTVSFAPTSSPTPAPTPEQLSTTIPTLPAIFPPSLLTTGTAQGKKGVLHTLWAKSRLHALRADMVRDEAQGPASEDVGAAQKEFEWICDNFGIGDYYGADASENSAPGPRGGEAPTPLAAPASLPSSASPYPTTPVSPGGSERFLSKMRGLRVGTNESTWSPGAHRGPAAQLQPTPPQTDSSNAAARNPLSPEAGDVAVGSFAAIKGASTSVPTAMGASQAAAPGRARTAVPIAPPSEITAQQGSGFGGLASLGGMTGAAKAASSGEDDEHDDELFALPISPRSPDMAKSPFSWDQRDVSRAAAAAASR